MFFNVYVDMHGCCFFGGSFQSREHCRKMRDGSLRCIGILHRRY